MEEKSKLLEKIEDSIASGGPSNIDKYHAQCQWKQEWMTVHMKQVSEFLAPMVSYVMKDHDDKHIFPVDTMKPCPVLDSSCDRLQVYSCVDPNTGTPEMNFLKSASGSYTPLQHIHNDITREIYEKTVNFIQLSLYDLFNPDNGSGFWHSMTIRINAVKQSLLDIKVNDSTLEPDMKNKLREDLTNYFQSENVSTLVLSSCGDHVSTDVLFGRGFLEEPISSFKFTVDSSSYCWFDISGIKKLSHTIINYSKTNKKNWGVLQVGCLTIVPSLFIARCSNSTVIVNLDSKVGEHILNNAGESDIQNLETTPRCDKEIFEEVLKNKFANCRHSCVVIFDCNTFLDGEAEIEVLKTIDVVRKIICVSSFESPTLLRKVVTACQMNSGLENEFVIAKVVPVEISPYEKLPVIVIVLERRLTLEDKVKKNYDYSSLAVKAFLEGGEQFEDFFIPAYDPDEELPKQDSKKHDSTECISSSNMNDNEVSVVYESSTEPVIYESSNKLQSSVNDEITVVYEGSTGCTSSNNETNDDVTVVYENTDQNNRPQNVNVNIEPKKLIVEMLQNGGPQSVEEYEVQLKLKEENLALDIQIFTQIMKTIIPNVMKKRNPGYLFQMDNLRRCSFVESLCDRLFVQSTTLKIRDPSLYSSKPKQRETRLIYGLTSDALDTPLSIPLTEIHSQITRSVYEKIQKVIEEFGQPLYDSVNNVGFWKNFLIRVNSFGQALLQVIVKISGGVEDAVAISSELEPLLKKHFQNNEEGKCYLETLILDIVHKRGTVNQVVFGEGYLAEVVGDFNLKLYDDFLWCDNNGIHSFSESIVNLVNVDSSWAIVQLGRGYIVPALYLAKQCGKYFLFCKNSKTCRNILDVAEENGITNIDCKCYGSAVKNVRQTFRSNLTSFKNICVIIMHDFNTHDDYSAVKFLKNTSAVKQITYIPKNININLKEIAVLCAEDSEHPGPFVIKDVVSVDISPRDNNVKTMLLLTRKSLVKSLIEKNKELCPELFPKLVLLLKENKRKMVKTTLISEMEKIISKKWNDCDVRTSKRNEDFKSNPTSSSRPVCSAAVQQLWTESRHETDECQEIRKAMEKLFSHSDPKFYVDYSKMYELKKKLLQVRMTSLSKKLDLFLPTLVCNRSPNFLFFLSELKRCPAIATMCERTYVNLESSPSHMEEVFELSRPCRTTSAKMTCERVKSFLNKHYINPVNSEEKVYWKNAVIRTNWNGKVWLMVECTVFTESVGKHMGTLIPLLKTHFTGKEAESCNIATLILKINAVNESATEVVLGDELMDDVIENFKVKVHGRNMVSSNPYAIKILSDTIVKLAEIDKTWAVLQLNSDTGIETLRLAKLCSVLYLSEIPQQSAVNLLVLDNKVDNAVFLPVPMESEFRDVVNNKLGTCENICVVYHLKNYDCTVSSVLRNNPNIKKIIFVSDIHYAYWAPNIVSCCLKQSGFSEPFVIKNVVPIDMSPSDDKIKVVFLLTRESLVNALVKTNPSYSQEKVIEYLNEINFEESNMGPDNCEVSFTTGKSNKNDNARDNHRSTVKNERNRKDRKRHSRDRSHSDIRGYVRTRDHSRTRDSSFKRYNPEPALPWDSRREVGSQSKHQSTKRTRSPTFGQEYERDKKIQKRNDGKNDLWFPLHEFTKKSTEQNFNKNISPWIGAQQAGGLLSQLAPKSIDVIAAQSLLQNTLRNEILEQVSRLNALSQIPLTDIVEKTTKSDLFGTPPLKDSLEMSGRYDLLQTAQGNTKQTNKNPLFSRDIIKETTQQNYRIHSYREVTHLSSSREPIRENPSTGRESMRETVQQNYGVGSYRGATNLSTTREPITENLSTGRGETVQQNYGVESYRGAKHLSTTREPIWENLSTGRGETVQQNYGVESYRGATHPSTTREPIRENLSTGRRETVQQNFGRESFIGIPHLSSSIEHIRENLSIGSKPAQHSYNKSYGGITHATSSLPLRENLSIGREPIREIAQQSYNKPYGGITHAASSLPLGENLSIGREPIREIAQQSYREEHNSGFVQHNSREELIREIAQQSYRLSLLQEALKNDLSQSSSGNVVQSRPLVETLGINVPQLPASVSTQHMTQNYGLFGNRMRDPASNEQNLSHSSNLFKRK